MLFNNLMEIYEQKQLRRVQDRLRECPLCRFHGTVDVANTDAEEMLAHRQAVVDDKVIVAVWSCAAPSLLLSGVSTLVCDPKLLISFPLLKNPAETCVTE